jgi:hypothetical protein
MIVVEESQPGAAVPHRPHEKKQSQPGAVPMESGPLAAGPHQTHREKTQVS